MGYSHRLSYRRTDKSNGERHYQITDRKICHGCVHYGLCTTAKKGRKIIRLPFEEIKEKLEAQYEETSSQEIYAKRKARVEHPFGHIKRNLKTDVFLLRGRTGVNAETSLLATCFNLARMITILGVSGLIQKLMVLLSLLRKKRLYSKGFLGKTYNYINSSKGGKNEVRHLNDILVIFHHRCSAASSEKAISCGNEAENHCHL